MNGVTINCPSCGHRWRYDGASTYYATCDVCGHVVAVDK